jgi:transcription antitermination factor NusG
LTPWYVATIETARHRAIVRALAEERIELYSPTEHVNRRTRRGLIVERELPLMPGYVFVHTDRLDLVTAVEGVFGIVGFPDATHLSKAAVERLYAIREAQAAGVFDRRRKGATLRQGQRVRIVRGPFMGMIAEISRLRGRRRCNVVMKALGMVGGGPAEMELADLEAA